MSGVCDDDVAHAATGTPFLVWAKRKGGERFAR